MTESHSFAEWLFFFVSIVTEAGPESGYALFQGDEPL
jgi:hypothetical protein